MKHYKILAGMLSQEFKSHTVVDLEFGKGGFQYAVTARVGCLLGGCGGMPPQENLLISDLLRSFLVYSWGEIAKVGRPTAKPNCCV